LLYFAQLSYFRTDIIKISIPSTSRTAGSIWSISSATRARRPVALASFGSYHRISDVPDLDDKNKAAFDGFSAEAKYRILDRRVFPFGLAISAEPEWRRHSETSGNRADAYGVEPKVASSKPWTTGTGTSLLRRWSGGALSWRRASRAI
jgi:hypothetical protein